VCGFLMWMVISGHTCRVRFYFALSAPSQISTLSLHDALPIYRRCPSSVGGVFVDLDRQTFALICVLNAIRSSRERPFYRPTVCIDRKSTRLNSSHDQTSYAVFCLKKKNKYIKLPT